MKFRSALVLALIAGTSVPALAAPAPRLQAHSLEDLAPLPMPYNEKANAAADVAAAKGKAKASHKLLLIDFGGNWCADCRVLGGVMDQPEMRGFINKHFVVVTVDSGRFDKNMDIPSHYGFKSSKASRQSSSSIRKGIA